MNPEVLDLWTRARQALHTATILTNDDPDASVSRSYYAAYYAVSALFAALGQSFHKHSAVEAAVHRDLVKTGKWPADVGAAYSWLVTLRYTADYGGGMHASPPDARAAVEKASRILEAVRTISPGA